METKTSRLIYRFLLVALVLAGLYVFFRWGLWVLFPFIIAFGLARLMEPVVDFLCRKWKWPRRLCSALCTLLAFGVLIGLCFLLFSRILLELGRLLESFPAIISTVGQFLETATRDIRNLIVAAPLEVQDFLSNSLDKITAEGVTIPQSAYTLLGNMVAGLAGGIPGLLLFITASVFSTYFASADLPRIRRWILLQFPDRWQGKIRQIKNHMLSTWGKWLKAQGMLMLLTFGEVCLGLMILRVDAPLVIAAGIALVDALPVLGSGTVLLPWALISLLSHNDLGIGLLILYGAVTVARSLAEYKLVGEQIGLPPILTIFSMYIGFCLMGILGMLLFPILAITLKQLNEWGYIRLWKNPTFSFTEKRK